MHIEWYGQSAFRLSDGASTVVIDPFLEMAELAKARGMRWDYPPISADADLLLVTHEHIDHNGVGAIGGDPAVIRSTAGTHESPIGEVVGIASEHDDVAGTARGANVMYVFTFGGLRVAHLGDLGQKALRPEQLAALGQVDLLLVPVGGGPTMGAAAAHRVAVDVGARWIVPHHYRTERIDFLETVDAFAAAAPRLARVDTSSFALEDLPRDEGPLVVVPAAP
jgi:L-ascorbate metabolism protein UlaG (beta-lactamase superfamily)